MLFLLYFKFAKTYTRKEKEKRKIKYKVEEIKVEPQGNVGEKIENVINEVISGIYNPAGRTPLCVPRSAGHLPLYHYQNNGSSAPHDKGLINTGYIDSESTALASFGHGLSYTEFEYRVYM